MRVYWYPSLVCLVCFSCPPLCATQTGEYRSMLLFLSLEFSAPFSSKFLSSKLLETSCIITRIPQFIIIHFSLYIYMYTPWFYPFADAYVSCEVDYRLVFRVQYTELSSSWLNTLYKFYSNLLLLFLVVVVVVVVLFYTSACLKTVYKWELLQILPGHPLMQCREHCNKE